MALGFSSSSGMDAGGASPELQNWIREEESLRQSLVLEDDFLWSVPSRDELCLSSLSSPLQGGQRLRYVGGVDLSFSKEDPSKACGGLVIVDIETLKVVHEVFNLVQLHNPYVPGFLAFREAPVLLELLDKVKRHSYSFYPQLLMVDGNGVLHPRGFGLACHLGVVADLPTVGIGKNLHHVDGLTLSTVRQQMVKAQDNTTQDAVALTGNSGRIWGVAMRSSAGSSKPIFISVGHRISLKTALEVVKICCKYRTPEPIRQADIRTRAYLEKH